MPFARAQQKALTSTRSPAAHVGAHTRRPTPIQSMHQAFGNHAVAGMLLQSQTTDKPETVQRKCACGGTCESCSDSSDSRIQTKLAVNRPGDQYEREDG